MFARTTHAVVPAGRIRAARAELPRLIGTWGSGVTLAPIRAYLQDTLKPGPNEPRAIRRSGKLRL